MTPEIHFIYTSVYLLWGTSAALFFHFTTFGGKYCTFYFTTFIWYLNLIRIMVLFYPDNPQLLHVLLLFTGESYPDQHGGDVDVPASLTSHRCRWKSQRQTRRLNSPLTDSPADSPADWGGGAAPGARPRSLRVVRLRRVQQPPGGEERWYKLIQLSEELH